MELRECGVMQSATHELITVWQSSVNKLWTWSLAKKFQIILEGSRTINEKEVTNRTVACLKITKFFNDHDQITISVKAAYFI